jgi:hypothetical protein
MSPRPVRLRKISNPQVILGFKLYGNKKMQVNPKQFFLIRKIMNH